MGGLATGLSHVPEAHFRHLRRNLHPPGRVFIWTTVHGLQPGATRFQVADVQSRGFTLESTHGAKFNGYAITVIIGHLAFQVLGHASSYHLHLSPPPIHGVPASRYEIRIWPVQPNTVVWPPSHGFDLDALRQYSQRFDAH